MPSHVVTLKRAGINAQQLLNQMGPVNSLVVSAELPTVTTRITLNADDYDTRQIELVNAAAELGYTVAGIDLPNVTPRTLYQLLGSALTANFSAVPADDWKTVLTQDVTTRGGTSLGIFQSFNADVALGIGGTAAFRVRVMGGPWGAGASVRGGTFGAGGVNVGLNHPLPIPAQGSDITITIALHVKVTGIGSQMTINANASPETFGAALSIAEYV